MKTLIALALFLIVLSQVNSYTYWDNWHNVPYPFKFVNSTNYEYTGTSWIRNTPTNLHPSGYFSNFSTIAYQYMYWSKANTSQIVFCRPKYYLVSPSLCAQNPIFWNGVTDSAYCVPNTYGIPNLKPICDETDPFNYPNPCCFKQNGLFEQTFKSIDPYPVPLM
jgi:hypothetical protein